MASLCSFRGRRIQGIVGLGKNEVIDLGDNRLGPLFGGSENDGRGGHGPLVVLGEESLNLDEDGEEWHDWLHVLVVRKLGVDIPHEPLQMLEMVRVDSLGLDDAVEDKDGSQHQRHLFPRAGQGHERQYGARKCLLRPLDRLVYRR